MKRAVIFGAGNIGRGFIGQLYCESGYDVVFVDIDTELVQALNRDKAYQLRMVTNQETVEVRVGPVSALLSEQTEAVAEALAQATLGATAVGARALKYVAPVIAQGVARRAAMGLEEPLNLIVCENLKDAAAILRGMVCEHLSPVERAHMDRWVGLADAVIGRMVPQPTEAMRAADPSLIVTEPYKELPVAAAGFVGQPPDIVGLELCAQFPVYTARKLYLHNAGHAVLGYLGYLRSHELGWQALEDPIIREALLGAWDEAVQGIVVAYGASEPWLRAHVADLLRRFANRALADPTVRLGRDPLRKLGPEDRLVGAARVAQQAGILPTHLAWGIAAALRFDAQDDGLAQAMQAHIAKEGVAAVLQQVCHIAPDEPLGCAILERYQRLADGRWA
jgi:mannitol-1-phosphate 5-dehydrogenase